MKIWILLITMLISIASLAQEERSHIRDGNKEYNNSSFEESEISYRKAIDKANDSYNAAFNLGDALYKQEKFEDAAKQFQTLTNKDLSKKELAKVYHNLGNSLLQSQDDKGQPRLDESIEAYKQALRNNPNDLETKYNLSFAMRMKQQQQQQQNENCENKDNKDENKEDKEQQQDQDQKEQDKQDEQQQEDSEEQKEEQEQQQPEPKEQEISKEDAERMLKALEDDEKEAQEKLKKAQVKTQKVKIEKDW